MPQRTAETFLRLARQPGVWTWFALVTDRRETKLTLESL